MNNFDKWLSRITAISQLALVGIAIATIKLTVIPLYQKELSSEELARAQLKLSTVQDQVDALQETINQKEARLKDTELRQLQISAAEEDSRKRLMIVNSELKKKEAELSRLRLSNNQMVAESSKLRVQLIDDNRQRVYQALEWFSMTSDLMRDCYNPKMSAMFENAAERRADAAKGCGPYRSLKEGIKSLRALRHDAAGDLLDIPYLDEWLDVAEKELERNKVNLRGAFDPAVYASLDSGNLAKKSNETSEDFYKRVKDLDKHRSDYSEAARKRDRDLQKHFIRNLPLQR